MHVTPAHLADRAALGAGAPGAGRQSLALGAALLGFFVITLDALVVNVALPAIGRGLGGGMTGLQWVVDGYTLMFAALLLSAGSLTDRFGARQAFGAGMVLFAVASAGCGLAPSLGVLVAARLVQGAGAAVIMPASLALIREAYPEAESRARAISLWALGGSVGSAAGPVAGGFLVLASWRMIFFVNLPVAVVALVLLARCPRSPRRPVPFDAVGQVAAVVAMGALTYGAIEAGPAGFGAPRVVGAFALAVVAVVVFLLAQAKGRHPMVPLALLRARTTALSVAIGFGLNVAFYGVVFVLSLYLQQERGLSALGTGLVFLPMALSTAVVSPQSARVAGRFGSRAAIVTGQAVMAAGLLLLATVGLSAPLWLLVVLMVPVGAGGALAVPALTALLLERVPAERAGTASGVLNTARQVGGALSVAAFGALVAGPARLLPGLHASLLIGAVVVALTGCAALLLRPAARG